MHSAGRWNTRITGAATAGEQRGPPRDALRWDFGPSRHGKRADHIVNSFRKAKMGEIDAARLGSDPF